LLVACDLSSSVFQVFPLLLLQALDTGINSWWESRNQGKLFKHMTIPQAEE
jgi:hypothetical protein